MMVSRVQRKMNSPLCDKGRGFSGSEPQGPRSSSQQVFPHRWICPRLNSSPVPLVLFCAAVLFLPGCGIAFGETGPQSSL